MDDDCPHNLACNRVAGECQDPCTLGSTGCEANKRCEVRAHRPVCVCKSGFVVSETGELTCAPGRSHCTSDDQCASNAACIVGSCQNPCISNNPCPETKTCEVLDHRPVCICTQDCNPALFICLRDRGCPPELACQGYQCVNPCLNFTCPDATPCYVEEHKPVCKFCPPGFAVDAKHGCVKGNCENKNYLLRNRSI